MSSATGVMTQTNTCDFCGGSFAGDWRLMAHERVCEQVPEEIRAGGKDAVLHWIRIPKNRMKLSQVPKMKGLRVSPSSAKGGGTWVCNLEGCGLGCRSAQGLGKHQATCKTRAPAERTEIRAVLEDRHNYGQTYVKKKKEGVTHWLTQARRDTGMRTANGARWVEPKPRDEVSSFRIQPTPMFSDMRNSNFAQDLVGSTNISFSVDLRGLLELGMKHLPELVQLVKSVQLERK